MFTIVFMVRKIRSSGNRNVSNVLLWCPSSQCCWVQCMSTESWGSLVQVCLVLTASNLSVHEHCLVQFSKGKHEENGTISIGYLTLGWISVQTSLQWRFYDIRVCFRQELVPWVGRGYTWTVTDSTAVVFWRALEVKVLVGGSIVNSTGYSVNCTALIHWNTSTCKPVNTWTLWECNQSEGNAVAKNITGLP